MIDAISLDKYTFVRDAYLQRRRSLVFDGDAPEVPDPQDTGRGPAQGATSPAASAASGSTASAPNSEATAAGARATAEPAPSSTPASGVPAK